MQGASVVQSVLSQVPVGAAVFVIWEPVLATDLGPPTTASLGLVPDPRVIQLWDPDHLLSQELERAGLKAGQAGVLWDMAIVWEPSARWSDRLPPPAFADGDVISVEEPFLASLKKVSAAGEPKAR